MPWEPKNFRDERSWEGLRTALPALVLLAGIVACGRPETTVRQASDDPSPTPDAPAIFSDGSEAQGLDFHHSNGMSGQLYFFEAVGGGAALLDYDDDGDLDVYLVQGSAAGRTPADSATLVESGAESADARFGDRLYRNDLTIDENGNRRQIWTDVTEESGIRAFGYGMGVAAGDYDNDGRTDLYVTNFGPNQMWRNNGDGSFTETAAQIGAESSLWDTSAAFVDYDHDGRLDLFVARYVDYRPETDRACRSTSGRPDYCGPQGFDGVADLLLRNLGQSGSGDEHDVRFAVADAGPGREPSSGLGVVDGDFDGDGRTDLYVANDLRRNHLWMGRADGSFENRALIAGAAVRGDGRAEASMGVVAGDADGDGDEDLFLTHLMSGTNTLYLNDGAGAFRDATTAAGLDAASLSFTGFGTAFLDFDNDGRLDLAAVNGSVNRLEDLLRAGDPFPLGQSNQLFRNIGTADRPRFAEVSGRAGAGFSEIGVSRGLAAGDVDNDGDTDLLIVNNHGPARLLINGVGQDNPWLGVRLLTRVSGSEGSALRDALGAVAVLHRVEAPALSRRVRTGGSYCSAHDPRLLFGLGEASQIDHLRVDWPSGRSEIWTDLQLGRYQDLVEDSGRAVGESAP